MKKNKKLWNIKTLWIGSSLSTIEQLSLKSFIAHGHRVELFTYGLVNNVPEGVDVRDANDILTKDKIFQYKKKTSYAAFADWFRYKMLYLEGGCWVDTDVVCLKPFDFDMDFFAGFESSDKINNAVLGAKDGMEFFSFMASQAENPNQLLPYDSFRDKRKKIYRKYFLGNHRGRIKWGEVGPEGLTKAVYYYRLYQNVLSTKAFYPVPCDRWTEIFDDSYPNASNYFPDSFAIHLWNEKIRRQPNFYKDASFTKNSLIEFLKSKYLCSNICY